MAEVEVVIEREENKISGGGGIDLSILEVVRLRSQASGVKEVLKNGTSASRLSLAIAVPSAMFVCLSFPTIRRNFRELTKIVLTFKMN